jgi:hypothetical protein
MNQQSPKRRPVRSQPQPPDGPFAIISTRNKRSQFPLPRNVQPSDAINILLQNPPFQNFQRILQDQDTEVEVVMYSRGQVVKGPFLVKERKVYQPGPPLSQNGVPIPTENLGHLNPQVQQQVHLPPGEQFDDGIYDDRLSSGTEDEYDQATAGELLRMKIDSLERQAEHLKSLIPLVDQFPVESPEELGMRELLRVGMEKE